MGIGYGELIEVCDVITPTIGNNFPIVCEL